MQVVPMFIFGDASAAMQHYLLLERNLIYTGITRGKQLVLPAHDHSRSMPGP